ncbi:hypothetical protein GCM10009579_33060 [Streptomyces javensis]|uniref:Uncharacterized protein n=2 Tax=Streptomyces javensis TaxID=114698 RepID=A0ABN1X0A0_9ACTN
MAVPQCGLRVGCDQGFRAQEHLSGRARHTTWAGVTGAVFGVCGQPKSMATFPYRSSPRLKDRFLMKQGTLKTLGVIALGAAAVVAGGSAASAAPVPGGSAGRVAAPGQPAAPAKPAAAQAKPAQGMLGQLPLGNLPTGGLIKLG